MPMTNTRTLSLICAALGGLLVAVVALIAGSSSSVTHRRLITAAGGRALASQVTGAEPLTPKQIYKQDAEGVVAIRASRSAGTTGPGGQGAARVDSGSGIILSASGLILTNEHVIDGATTITVSLDGAGSTMRSAHVIASNRSLDLALLKISPTGLQLHALTLADSGTVQVGEAVSAIGNPFALDWTLTTGVVSAVGREIHAPNGSPIDGAIQTDAALNPGNSGGPLINSSGEVIGVNSQIVSASSSTGSGGSEGLGFAIPSNTVSAFVARYGA
jgi:putative serine protease PepD